MLHKTYSIRDAKSGLFSDSFNKKTHGEAERYFHILVNDEQTMLHRFPEDYDLYHLGEYDDVKGTFISLKTPEHIIKAVQVKKDPRAAAGHTRIMPNGDVVPPSEASKVVTQGVSGH